MARTGRNLITSVAFKLSANAMAPPSPISFVVKVHLGDGLVHPRGTSAITNAGTPLVAHVLCWTITKPRSRRCPHLDNRAKVIAACARFASLLLLRRGPQ